MPRVKKPERLRTHLLSGFRLLRDDRNYQLFYIVRMCWQLTAMAFPFYSVYAYTVLNYSETTIGIFVSIWVGSGVASNYLWGWLMDRRGNKVVLAITALLSLFPPLTILFLQYVHGGSISLSPAAVFLAIALHADQNGWAYPSRATLARETGYNPDTITSALAALCQTTINGHRLLLKYQPQAVMGQFSSNHYLIFPTDEEIAQFEATQPTLTGLPLTENPVTVKPVTEEPLTDNHPTKKNHIKGEPKGKEEPEDEEDSIICPIHQTPMHQCHAQDGDTWYAHRLRDGTWCKPPPRPPKENGLTYITGEFADYIQH